MFCICVYNTVSRSWLIHMIIPGGDVDDDDDYYEIQRDEF